MQKKKRRTSSNTKTSSHASWPRPNDAAFARVSHPKLKKQLPGVKQHVDGNDRRVSTVAAAGAPLAFAAARRRPGVSRAVCDFDQGVARREHSAGGVGSRHAAA